jgi:murein DD-endopeptidase MepM/ murein hydrolase activator NlpD
MTRRDLAAIAAAALWRGASTLGARAGGAVAIALRARSFQPGEAMLVTVSAPEPMDRVEVRVIDAPVTAARLGPERWEAIAGIDLDRPPGAYAVTAAVGEERVTEPFTVTARAFPTRTLTVNPDFVTPPRSVAARIEAETRLLAQAYGSGAAERLWAQPFVRPVPQPANSRFGTRSVFNGEPRSPHGGTDFLSPAGTPIHAPNDGRVLVARPLYFAGGSVLLDHGAGLFSQMAHMSRIDVKEGQAVRRGEVLGLVGATGRVTGAHLHWAVRAAGARVDALSLLALLGPD